MGQKRLSRAQTQRRLDQVLDEFREMDEYGGRVQAQVRAELGSAVPPQQERDILENGEKMNEHYKELSEFFKAKAAKEVEECMSLEDDIKSAERAAFKMRAELEILKLKKVDPELDDRQLQVLSRIKARLLEYPALLEQVTGNETFMQAIKKSYESKLEEFETKLKGLIGDVFELPFNWSSNVSTLLTDFAEKTLEPAISIVKQEHEQLEKELGKANEESEGLKKRIEGLEANAERASEEIRDLTLQHHTREQRLTDDNAALEKKLETIEEAYRIQRETHQREKTNLIAQLEKARTNAAAEVKLYEKEIESYRASTEEVEKGKEDLEESVKRWQERVNVRRQENDRLRADCKTNAAKLRSAEEQVFSLEENLRTEKDMAIAAKETAAQEIQSLHEKVEKMTKEYKDLKAETRNIKASSDETILSLQGELSTEKTEKVSIQRSHEGELQRVQSQLATARTEMASLKQSTAQQVQKLQGEISTVKTEKTLLQRSHEGEIQEVQSQLATAMTDMDSLKESTAQAAQKLHDELSRVQAEKKSMKQMLKDEVQSLENKLGKAMNDIRSIRKSGDDEAKSLRGEISGLKTEKESLERAFQSQLQWHISTVDNIRKGELESIDVLAEMGAIVGTMEQYAGSTTEMVSVPQYMPRMTIVGKATELVEPNLAAARRLWISSRSGSLALDVAQAFFMQREISSAQFALLPWIHASLNRAVTTMCEKTLTPDLAMSSVWILQGLVYIATVAREWSEGVWNPKIEEMLAQMTHWLGKHVSEASLLMMVVGQVNRMVTNESPSTSISPNDVSESRRIDSVNSDIADGMAMVVDISGIIILFTADNAFIFGANEVKALEIDIAGSMVIKLEQAVIGLPATLVEIPLLNLDSPIEVFNKHEALLKSVLPRDRCVSVYPFKKRRLR